MKVSYFLPRFDGESGISLGYAVLETRTRIYSGFIERGTLGHSTMVCRLDSEPGWHFSAKITGTRVPRDTIRDAIKRERNAARKFDVRLIEQRDANGKRTHLSGFVRLGNLHFNLNEKEEVEDLFDNDDPTTRLPIPLGLIAAIGKALCEIRFGSAKQKKKHQIIQPVKITAEEKAHFEEQTRKQFAGTPFHASAIKPEIEVGEVRHPDFDKDKVAADA